MVLEGWFGEQIQGFASGGVGGGREERSEVLRDEGQICSFFQVNVSEVCEAICFYNLSAKLFLL